MTERDWLAERFEEQRDRLRAVAYRMLGSTSEADDAVQEAWLRLSRTDATSVDNMAGWLTTTVGRICLDMLRARKSRREEPLDDLVPTARWSARSGGRGGAGRVRWPGAAGCPGHAGVRSAWPSCCTTSLTCRSRRSLPSWAAPRTPTRQLASRARRRVRGAHEPEAPAGQRRRIVGGLSGGGARRRLSGPAERPGPWTW